MSLLYKKLYLILLFIALGYSGITQNWMNNFTNVQNSTRARANSIMNDFRSSAQAYSNNVGAYLGKQYDYISIETERVIADYGPIVADYGTTAVNNLTAAGQKYGEEAVVFIAQTYENYEPTIANFVSETVPKYGLQAGNYIVEATEKYGPEYAKIISDVYTTYSDDAARFISEAYITGSELVGSTANKIVSDAPTYFDFVKGMYDEFGPDVRDKLITYYNEKGRESALIFIETVESFGNATALKMIELADVYGPTILDAANKQIEMIGANSDDIFGFVSGVFLATIDQTSDIYANQLNKFLSGDMVVPGPGNVKLNAIGQQTYEFAKMNVTEMANKIKISIDDGELVSAYDKLQNKLSKDDFLATLQVLGDLEGIQKSIYTLDPQIDSYLDNINEYQNKIKSSASKKGNGLELYEALQSDINLQRNWEAKVLGYQSIIKNYPLSKGAKLAKAELENYL